MSADQPLGVWLILEETTFCKYVPGSVTYTRHEGWWEEKIRVNRQGVKVVERMYHAPTIDAQCEVILPVQTPWLGREAGQPLGVTWYYYLSEDGTAIESIQSCALLNFDDYEDDEMYEKQVENGRFLWAMAPDELKDKPNTQEA